MLSRTSGTKKKYLIGTRGSLLARTQCMQLRDILEKVAKACFEIKTIKTTGDVKTDVPLWQLEGNNFFTKELDRALLDKEVDLVVHSYKDLGSKRPANIQLAAVSKRTYPNDILLIKKDTIKKLQTDWKKGPFIVGTSSPRRIFNIQSSLKDYLPTNNKNIEVTCEMLRGNINNRIKKLQDGKYDCIILALAGIERLAQDQDSCKVLADLLKNLNFMVLPESIFPSAAAQGALAIECRTSAGKDQELLSKLKLIEDNDTREETNMEREAFNSYGGGCHLAVGINVKKIKDNLFLHIHRGQKDDSKVNKIFLTGHDRKKLTNSKETKNPAFLGLPLSKMPSPDKNFIYDEFIEKIPHTNSPKLDIPPDTHTPLLITSSYCIPMLKKIAPFTTSKTIWAAGNKTMPLLAQNGFWSNGSADSLGEKEIANLLKSKALQLMMGQNDLHSKFNYKLYILTNDLSSSKYGETIPSYDRLKNSLSSKYIQRIKKCEIFFWTSFFQYQTFIEAFPEIEERTHCAGLGKTFDHFVESKIPINNFASVSEYKKWVKQL